MKAAVLFLCLVTTAAARPAGLPTPPIPPSVPPPIDAPVPNLAIENRFDTAVRPAVSLDLGINHRAAPEAGVAFAPGSQYQIDNDRRWLVLPGIMVRVPFP